MLIQANDLNEERTRVGSFCDCLRSICVFPNGNASTLLVHLLLSDIIMPQLNGTELALRLRELLPSLSNLLLMGDAMTLRKLPIKVLVTDHDPQSRDRLSRLDFGLRLQVQIGSTGYHILHDMERSTPDLLIIGHATCPPLGVDLEKLKQEIQVKWPTMKVIFQGGDPSDLVGNISWVENECGSGRACKSCA